MESQAESSSKLNVCLRIKPSSSKNDAYTPDCNNLRVTSLRGTENFQFTNIFREASSQTEVFDTTTKASVEKFLNGEDCLTFAYGTTNAGKTFSVQGTPSEPGLIPRSVQHMFDAISSVIDDNPRIAPLNYKQAQIRNAQERLQNDCIKASIIHSSHVSPPAVHPPSEDKFSISFAPHLSSTLCELNTPGSSPKELPQSFNKDSRCSLWISMLEVYNENVYDLLAPIPKGIAAAKSTVKLLSDGMGNFIPHGNVEVYVKNLQEARAILNYGQKQRTTVATLLNISSSRSHCILRVRLLRIDRFAQQDSPTGCQSPAADVEDFHVSTFMFIDLAGSERVDKAGTLKNRARETGNINSSLLVLGRCIEMLKLKGLTGNTSKNSVVPYRDSKLTMILQPLLSASGSKSLLVNINTTPDLFEETMNVLKFSCVARSVVFKEPPKPISKTKIPVLDCTDVSVLPAVTSDSDSLRSDLTSNSDHVEEVNDLKKHISVIERELKKRCDEIVILQDTLKETQAKHCKRENEIKHAYEIIEQEIEVSHKEALENKENQLITLMEKRLDIQENFYKGKLAEKSANYECLLAINQTLEDAVLKWEDYTREFVPKSELEKLRIDLNLEKLEKIRLNKLNEEHLLEISNLTGNIEHLRQSQQNYMEETRGHEEELLAETTALQNEIKSQMVKISSLTNTLDDKEAKIQHLKQSKKAISLQLNEVRNECERYKKMTKFVVDEYHPSARDSLATHNEEETWAILEKEFNNIPSKCRELEKENIKLNEQLRLREIDYKNLEERRNKLLSLHEDEMRLKSSQLEMEKREVQALQKQLMGMTPRKMDITPQKMYEFKTPMTVLSNSVRSSNLNSPSPSISGNISMPVIKTDDISSSVPLTRSSGRKKKTAKDLTEKENSPLPTEKAGKKKTTRRKLCNQSAHPALDSNADDVFSMEEADFKVPEENEVQRTRRRLRSTYK